MAVGRTVEEKRILQAKILQRCGVFHPGTNNNWGGVELWTGAVVEIKG